MKIAYYILVYYKIIRYLKEELRVMIDKILSILNEEIVPAEGCTEPIALAYIGSKLTSILGGVPEKIDIALSGNLIKNVKSVKIPNSEGMVGIEAAVALGTILGDSKKDSCHGWNG